MSVTNVITLRLGPEDYERLAAEAVRLGVTPSQLVRRYVQARLDGSSTAAEKRRQTGLDALDRLAELTRDLPAADAVQIARDSRAELEERSGL